MILLRESANPTLHDVKKFLCFYKYHMLTNGAEIPMFLNEWQLLCLLSAEHILSSICHLKTALLQRQNLKCGTALVNKTQFNDTIILNFGNMLAKHLFKLKNRLYADHMLVNRTHQWVHTCVPVIFFKITNFQVQSGWILSIHISTTFIQTVNPIR